jgi:hypothetical protein
MGAMRTSTVVLAFALAAACDGKAKSEQVPGAAAPSQVSSRSMESCARSADCLDGLRCVDQRCATIERSAVGDQLAAAGRDALARGDAGKAAEYYLQAVAKYEAEVLEPPADLYCEQGKALTALRMDKQKAEAAARVLHRCLLAVPPGSRLARGAHDSLAKLMQVGLDPELLSRKEPADLYLTKEPSQPSLDKLPYKVTGDSKNRRKSHAAVIEALSEEATKSLLGPCWEANWKATQKKTLEVTLPVSYRFILDEDDEALDRAVLEVEDSKSPGEAASCVKQVVTERLAAVAKASREDTRWKATITVHLGP